MANLRDIPLPDGVSWRALTNDDKRWIAATTGGEPDTFVAINISLTIRHPDGRERTVIDDWYPFAVEPTVGLVEGIRFQWTEGNYGCDCNRAMSFARAGGDPDPDHIECGGRYLVVAPPWLSDPAPPLTPRCAA